jgi:hypothetical protein
MANQTKKPQQKLTLDSAFRTLNTVSTVSNAKNPFVEASKRKSVAPVEKPMRQESQPGTRSTPVITVPSA